MTISLIHKILLQIYALASSRYHQDKDQTNFNKYTSLWLGTFENWHILLKGGDSPKVTWLLDILSQARSKVINSRTSALQITVIYPHLPDYSIYNTCHYKDNWMGTKGGLGICYMRDMKCNKALGRKIFKFKSNLIRTFITALDKLVDVQTIIDKTELAFKMWMNHIKPLPPETNTITISFKDSTTPTPKGKWVKGRAVRYAVKFKNTVGEALSSWSVYFDVMDKAFPTLNNIPIDKHELIQAR